MRHAARAQLPLGQGWVTPGRKRCSRRAAGYIACKSKVEIMQRSKLGGAGSCYDLVIVAASCMVSQACNGMISLLYIYLSTINLSICPPFYPYSGTYHVQRILDGWNGLHPFHVALSHQCKLHGLDNVNASTAQQDRRMRNVVNSLQER